MDPLKQRIYTEGFNIGQQFGHNLALYNNGINPNGFYDVFGKWYNPNMTIDGIVYQAGYYDCSGCWQKLGTAAGYYNNSNKWYGIGYYTDDGKWFGIGNYTDGVWKGIGYCVGYYNGNDFICIGYYNNKGIWYDKTNNGYTTTQYRTKRVHKNKGELHDIHGKGFNDGYWNSLNMQNPSTFSL